MGVYEGAGFHAEFSTCAHGGGADLARRARFRHLLAPAQGEHHFPGYAHRRQRREPDHRPDALPGRGRPGKGYFALHQFSGWLDHRGFGHSRHHEPGGAGHRDLLRGPGRFHGRRAAGLRKQGQALQPAAFAHPDPSAVHERPGRTGHRHRYLCARNPAHARVAERDSGQRHRPGGGAASRAMWIAITFWSPTRRWNTGIIDRIIESRALQPVPTR